ncbi:MAG: hypothetical protein Q8R83_01230 [Legionellaceae bacterium]|nr:hypothetical protein [Legionellaceae bacterium]
MLKKIVYLLLLVGISDVSLSYDVNYYKMNPNQIEQALLDCQDQQATSGACNELSELEGSVNKLIAELRMDPQAYGRTILAMQEAIAKQMALAKQQSTPELKIELAKNQQLLRERLSVIKWLESPVAH